MILGLDLASLDTGYALVTRTRPTRLIDCGVLRVSGKDPILRIGSMNSEIVELIEGFQPANHEEPAIHTVALEMTSGKVSQRHGGGGSGLAIYGMALGAAYARLCAEMQYSPHIHNYALMPIRENVWTKGRPKHKRMEALSAEFPLYRQALKAGSDNGGDVADAIGVALYAQMELIRREAMGDRQHKRMERGANV